MVMSPVDFAIFTFGGPQALAKAVGVTHSAVCQWKTRGQIPVKRCPEILAVARTRGLDINASDLLEGRKMGDDNA